MKKVKEAIYEDDFICHSCSNYMGIGEENFDGSFECRGTVGIDADDEIINNFPESCPLDEIKKQKLLQKGRKQYDSYSTKQ